MLRRCWPRSLPSACNSSSSRRNLHRPAAAVAVENLPIPEQGRRDEYNSKIREYFYYVDHQGQLFLADAKHKNFTSCFKEQAFLNFFFKQLRMNRGEKYTDFGFKYVSLCGPERNYVRCDDLPFVVTEIVQNKDDSSPSVVFNYAKKLICPFQPDKLYMSNSGRIYHPSLRWTPDSLSSNNAPLSVGLMKSALALELAPLFVYQYAGGDDENIAQSDDRPPTHVKWRDKTLALDSTWLDISRLDTPG